MTQSALCISYESTNVQYQSTPWKDHSLDITTWCDVMCPISYVTIWLTVGREHHILRHWVEQVTNWDIENDVHVEISRTYGKSCPHLCSLFYFFGCFLSLHHWQFTKGICTRHPFWAPACMFHHICFEAMVLTQQLKLKSQMTWSQVLRKDS